MSDGILTYNGTTYRLGAAAVADLLERGVIVADPMVPGTFELAREHTVDELGPDLAVLGHQTGTQARGEGDDATRRMLAVRFMHRDGQGGVR